MKASRLFLVPEKVVSCPKLDGFLTKAPTSQHSSSSSSSSSGSDEDTASTKGKKGERKKKGSTQILFQVEFENILRGVTTQKRTQKF